LERHAAFRNVSGSDWTAYEVPPTSHPKYKVYEAQMRGEVEPTSHGEFE
jgi:hypothetical protein